MHRMRAPNRRHAGFGQTEVANLPFPHQILDRPGDVSFSQQLTDTADRLRGFELKDADGYVLFFGRPT
jgi:hypothetical protein